MKKKSKILLIVFVILYTIFAGAAVLLLSETSQPLPTEVPAKQAKKAIVDGDMTNIEETLSAQHIYQNYRIKALRISKQGPAYAIVFIVDNISKKAQEHQNLNFSFLDSNKKLLNEINIEIPELQPGQTTTIYQYGSSESIYNAFDYIVSKSKELIIPKNEE